MQTKRITQRKALAMSAFDIIVMKAQAAIDAVFNDRSGSAERNHDALGTLKDHVETCMEALEADMNRDE